jgi:hypothetical protein
MLPIARLSEKPLPARPRRRRAGARLAALRVREDERAGVRFLVGAIPRNFDVGAP